MRTFSPPRRTSPVRPHRNQISIAGIVLLVLAAPAIGQRGGAAALRKKLESKLAQPWVENADWITDFDKAKAEAKKRKKPIFGYFTRSYSP